MRGFRIRNGSEGSVATEPPPKRREGDLLRMARRFAPYLRPRWAGFALALLGLVGETASDLANPWPLKLIFDMLLGRHRALFGISLATRSDQMLFLGMIAAAMVVLAVLNGLFSYWREYSLSRTSQQLAFDLRAAVYAQIQRLSLGFHERQRTGD